MKNFHHVLRQEKNKWLDGKSETFVDLMLESKDDEFAYLAHLIDTALTMTLMGTKYYIELDEDGDYDPDGVFKEE